MQMMSKNGAFVDLITHRHPKSAAAEAYRTLRTNLGFAAPDGAARVILATSAGSEEGKTTTVSNLAVVFAQAGHSVCLVDADLRKPRLHKVFGLESTAGLTNVLSQKTGLDEVILDTEVARLALLPSGPIPPNPAELLASGRMKEVLGRLAERYNYVLVDSPPVLAVTDASLLAGQVDGVLLVIRGGTRVEMAQEAKVRLARVNGRLLGVVLNWLRLSSKDYGYYYYYHHSKRGVDQMRL